MKLTFAFLILIILAFVAAAQKADDILATATGHTFRLKDLSPDVQKDVAELPSRLPLARTTLLDQLVSQRVFDAESKARGITAARLVAAERAKAPDPSPAEIKTVLDANQAQLAGLTPEEARKRVIAYLRTAPEQKVVNDFFSLLKAKYKVIPGKDVNAPNLVATDVVVTVNGQPITAKEFENFTKIPIYEAKAELADAILDELDETIYAALLEDEAKARGIDAGTLIGREVTDKMKEFTEQERVTLQDAFAKVLYAKYQVKFLYTEPPPPVQNVSVDDDPSTGPATAPVTIVMFSDFQCSACSATHPILKKAMAEFPGQIRFVVRDFPLESLHPNAFRAALAAGAANAQGKFFEYTEILYTHQDALDDVSLSNYAALIGLNVKQFELDFNSAAVAAEVRKDMADGLGYGISSTPTIFVNGVTVRNISPAGFRAAIKKALAK